MKLYSSLLMLAVATTCYFWSFVTVGAITVDLIHRDSPLSPFYNSLQSDVDRRYNAFARSSSPKYSQLTQTLIRPGPGDYLMNLSLGTPPTNVLVIADTGSDLIWTQCQPCDQQSCFPQPDPPFDPRQSSTYADLPCQSTSCTGPGKRTQCDSGSCIYLVQYGDTSYSSGNLATETLTLGDASVPDAVIGCGHKNQFHSSATGGASGIAGLGGGPLSLVSQLGSLADGKFSYCLVPLSSATKTTSKLSFGAEASVSGPGAVSTPLTIKQEKPTFYYLTLEGMSVGEQRLSAGGGGSAPEGNIIIDSGTTLTLLEPNLYNELESALVEAIEGERVTGLGGLCYKSESEVFEGAPIITAHFRGGADVKLNPINTFVKIREDVACLAMTSSEGLAIYGNVSQKNFLVGYDIQGNKLTFMPADCTRH